jgi:hypothetical protein
MAGDDGKQDEEKRALLTEDVGGDAWSLLVDALDAGAAAAGARERLLDALKGGERFAQRGRIDLRARRGRSSRGVRVHA